MHPKILEAVIATCRARIAEGDFPTTKAESVEVLEDAVVQLSDAALRHIAAARAEALSEAKSICDDYGRDGRTWKEYAAETADELAARIRALMDPPA